MTPARLTKHLNEFLAKCDTIQTELEWLRRDLLGFLEEIAKDGYADIALAAGEEER